VAHWALGVTQLYMGQFTSSLVHLEHVIHFYDPQQHRSLVFLYGMDPGIFCRAHAAWAVWFLGYPDQALKRIQEMLALARDMNHPLCLCMAFLGATLFRLLRRENRIAQDYANSLIQANLIKGFPLFQGVTLILLGRLKMEEGRIEEGKDQMRQALARIRSVLEWSRPFFIAWLAQACAKSGQVEEGLSLLEEALAMIETGGERLWEAEVHRVKGELLQSCGRVSEAEACFRQAIEVAHRQKAKSWELGATMSLSRLLQEEGRCEEARPLLSEVYGWFTEGFDTPDLKEARSLLDELGGPKER